MSTASVGAHAVKLIFHIGSGKTGSSSIQATLKNASATLAKAGVRYLGLMLEHAEEIYPWQHFGGNAKLHALDDEEGGEQIAAVLAATVAAARRDGIHTLIWSSESFFDRPDKAFPALRQSLAEGVDVQCLVYLRNHAQWSRSAYLQWGLRHKTMAGRVLPFKAYVGARRPVFFNKVRRFTQAFPDRVIARNFDTCGDVVADFLGIAGLGGLSISPMRENTTAGDTELLLRALYNNGFKQPVLPVAYNKAIGRHLRLDRTPTGHLAGLLPTACDLELLRERTTADRADVNALLEAQGQASLGFDARPATLDVDRHRLLFVLVSLALQQAHQISALEAQLDTDAAGPRP